MSLAIYYDGECPFCSRFVQLLRLRESVGRVRLVDLRHNETDRQRLAKMGLDFDKGMVVDTGGHLLGGSEAVQALTMLSTRAGWFNKLAYALLSNPTMAALLYPVLRAGRWLTLFALGRQGFAQTTDGLSCRASIFGIFFALFSLFHVLNLNLEYGRFPPSWDSALVFAAALGLLFMPSSPRMLFLLMLASTVSTIVQMPISSNHMMVRAACLLGYWMAFVWCAARSLPWQEIFRNFAPAGQAAILIMYVFGIFHKINTGFLNPETSCAVALWQKMPLPLSLIQGPAMDYLAIYGTFVVEGAIIVMLLTPRYRHYGVALGIGFHMLLSLSSYAMYISFTTLSISLHSLFLSEESAQRIWHSRPMQIVRDRMHNPAYVLLGFVLISGAALMAAAGQYSLTTMFAMILVIPFCVLVLRYGGVQETKKDVRQSMSPRVIGGTVAVLLFLNCFLPYFGLKTAQSINMFANLRLEAGVSNHLLFPNGPGPFTYLDDVAILEDVKGDPLLEGIAKQDLHVVYYDLLAAFRRSPDLVVTFNVNGERFVDATAAQFADQIDDVLLPDWINKWFHFQPVSLSEPEPCNV